MLKKKSPFSAHPQKRQQWCDLTTAHSKKPCILEHSVLRRKSKLSNYNAATTTGLWEDFAPLQPQIWHASPNHYMHFSSTRSWKRAPGTTVKKNNLHKNHDFQSRFPSIKIGPSKHNTKLGLRHVQLWEPEQCPPCSTLTIPWTSNI